MSEKPALRIERATERDVPLILELINGLAVYEKLAHEVTATEAGLRETLFGARPAAEVIIGYTGDTPVGFALFFPNFSTFLGKPGLYLEDLYIAPEWRGHGFGRGLLTELAKIAVARGCGRFEWSVLDWNEPAIGFYKSLGAKLMDGWSIFRVTGDALTKLAALSPGRPPRP
jgi:GNAT superfamily N-acetyltransferase